MLSHFNHVQLFAAPWTVAHQTPLSMGFSRQEYWIAYALLQGIFPTQGLNPHLLCLLHWEASALQLVPPGKPYLRDIKENSFSHWSSLMAQMVKNLTARQEARVQPLDQEDPLEKEMATHSSILAWRIPWTEEPGGLQSTALQKVKYN